MGITNIISIFIGIFVVIATLLPFIKLDHWWIRIFDFPRLQLVFMGLLSITLFIITWQNHTYEYIIGAGTVLAMGYQCFMIFPYTIFSKKEVLTCKDPGDHPVFSIMVMNVYMYNRNAVDAHRLIHDNKPDILVMVETDQWWTNQMDDLKKHYPFHVLVPLENTYGMLFYSKFKLINPQVKYILSDEIPSVHTDVELNSGEIFRFYAVHPKPPAPGHSKTSTNRDAELITIGKETREDENPVIVAGDLNDVAWSFTTNLFQRFSELLDPRKGRGMFSTFHARYWLFRWPLDHIFHSDHFQLLEIKTLPYFGSDHFPIYVRLCYMPSKRHKQDEPEADIDEVEEAHDKVKRAKEEE